MNIELWQKAVEFHGHKCVGLAFGFRMGEEAKKIFGEDEEIYCRMPVKSCITDGITGATGASVENGRIQVDESLNNFIFYIYFAVITFYTDNSTTKPYSICCSFCNYFVRCFII